MSALSSTAAIVRTAGERVRKVAVFAGQDFTVERGTVVEVMHTFGRALVAWDTGAQQSEELQYLHGDAPEHASDGFYGLVGTPVISWSNDGVLRYLGPHAHAGQESVAYSGRGPELRCDPDRVAPAGTPIPEKDDRVVVAKLTTKREYWMRGPWKLELDDLPLPSYHRIKRDAVTTGLRQLAIIDWQVDSPLDMTVRSDT